MTKIPEERESFLQVDIESMSPSGDGVARAGRRAIGVPFTIPGERVRVRLPESSRPGAAVTLVAVLRASPHRVVPRCPHFGPDAVGPGGRSLGISPQGALRLWPGRHHVRGSRRVVPVRECPVHDPRGNAPAFHFRDAIEESTLAVADGEASRALNGIPPARCRFIARPVEHALAGGLRTGGLKAAGYRPDVVVLDPPREGCTAAVVRKVFGGLRPARAIYISCNPEALARDLALIAARGYTIQSLQPVDMFPHTAHVETVAILAR